jgi:Damage-control phosphatase ARMT1-like domain
VKREAMMLFLPLLFILAIEIVVSLKPPVNLPLALSNDGGTLFVKNRLVPILQASMTESRVHLLGKGEALNMLESLKEEMLSGVLSSSSPVWQQIITAASVDRNMGWDSLTNEAAEKYFYYRIAVAVQANSVPGGGATFDCFLDKKLSNLKNSQPFLEEISGRLPDIVMATDPLESLEMFLFVSLWSMQKDRKLICNDDSITGTAKKRRAFADGVRTQMSYLASNDIAAVLKLFDEGKSGRGDVSIIVGNTGKELAADLALAYTLLTSNLCETVTFHTKRYTANEFGATNVDVYGHVEHLADPVHSSVWAMRHFGEALRTLIFTGRLKIEDDEFWCLPTPFWELPAHLEAKLSSSRLVIIKGDDNYGRMLGGLDWPLTTESNSVLNYWHVPVCALRVLESEVGCGFDDATARQAGFNKAFMNSGRWGQVQFYAPDALIPS